MLQSSSNSKNNSKFNSQMVFGECNDGQPIYLAKLININQQQILVPYTNPSSKVANLIQNYKSLFLGQFTNSNAKTEQNPNKGDKNFTLKNKKLSIIYDPQQVSINDIKTLLDNGDVQIINYQCKNIKIINKIDGNTAINNQNISLTISGEEKQFTISISQNSLVQKLKIKISKYLSIPFQSLQLTYQNKRLGNQTIIKDYQIKNNAKLSLNYIVKSDGVIYAKNSVGKIVKLKVVPSDSILTLKRQFHSQQHIPIQKLKFIFAGTQLENNKTLSDYNIKMQTTIHFVIKENQNNQSFTKRMASKIFATTGNQIDNFQALINQYKVKIKLFNNSSISVEYGKIRSLKVYQLVEQFTIVHKSHYCLLFGKIFLHPQTFISSIQNQQGLNLQKFDSFEMILLKNTQKLVFSQFITSKVQFPYQYLKLSQQDKIKKQRAQQNIKNRVTQQKFLSKNFFYPLLYYTINQNSSKVNEYLNKIQIGKIQSIQNCDEMKFIISLINSLRKLPVIIQNVYKSIQNFRISAFKKEGDSFYWKSFVSATISKQQVKQQFKHKNGTFFHISSLTGKQLGIFSINQHQQQIIFEPFTYFVVQRIIKHDNYDEVWLCQMPSPTKLQKHMILWVDDQPSNNLKQISQIKSRQQDKIQILTLTSTYMTQLWIKQFGWVLNWMNIELRIISDMVRVERLKANINDDSRPKLEQNELQNELQNGVIKRNFEAGIDLLQRLYNYNGFTVPILIYCKDLQTANQSLKKRNILKDRIYKVSKIRDQLYEYADFSRVLDGKGSQNNQCLIM